MFRKATVAAAFALAAAVLTGCGSPWVERPVASIDESTTSLGAEYARFTLEDGRVIELRLLRVEYPYVFGNRRIRDQVARAELRLDLSDVSRVELEQP